MKTFGVLVLLVAALLFVTAVPSPQAYGLVVCGNEVECLSSLYGRAIMGSSIQGQGVAAPSSSVETTVTVDAYTTVPCSDETGVTASTSTVSKHTTSTDFLTVTVTSSSSITGNLGVFSVLSLTPASITSNTPISTTASTSSFVTFTSVDTLSTSTTFSALSSLSTSTLVINPFFSTSITTQIVSSSTSSVGGVKSTSVTTNMAYISPSYALGPSTAPPAYSGITILSTALSVDAISASPPSYSPAAVTVITQQVIPIAASTGAGFTTLTTCSTSTRTTIINVGFNPSYTSPNYAGAISSVLASISLISEKYYSTTPMPTITATISLSSLSTEQEACSALSTVWVTITGTAASTAAASIPANPLDSQFETSSGISSSPSTLDNTNGSESLSSTLTSIDAISAPGFTSAALTGTTSPPPMSTGPASAPNGSSGIQFLNGTTTMSSVSNVLSTLASATSSTTGGGLGGNTNSMAPAARGNNHVNIALVLCVVGAMLMFAV